MTSETILILGLGLNFIGTVITIMRSQLKTENRITKVETLVGILVREMKPKNMHFRTSDRTDFKL